jgi:hypothetical protein
VIVRPLANGLSASRRNTAVEGFRGVVVAAVVAYHLVRLLLTRQGGSWGSEAPPWLWWLGVTRFGVDAFFVLAGFFVVTSWRQCRRRAASAWGAVRDFGERRVRRIFPAFWLAAAAFGIPAFLAGRIGAGDLGLLAIGQQYLREDLPGHVDLPMWSLTTEVQFYVAVPLLGALARWGRGWPLLAAALGLSVWWAWWPGRELATSLLPGRVDQFVVGIVAGQLVVRARRGERPLPVRLATARGAGWALAAILVALGTFHGATYQKADAGFLELLVHPAAGLVLGGIVLRLVLCPPSAVLDRPAWRFLGLISYGLYLWHYPILDHGFGWLGLREDPLASTVHVVVACALLLAASLLAGVLSYALVEQRFGSVRRRPAPEVAPDPVVGPAVVSGLTARTSP